MTKFDTLKIATDITNLQHDTILQWKKNGVQLCQTGFLRLVEENHAFNYQLWHAEDKARREDMGHTFVYNAKREIDKFNQQRNNRMEFIDEWLFNKLKPATLEPELVHSETPGMMIDRLSILELKHHHMEQQTFRQDVDEQHRQTCLNKSRTLIEQKQQLTQCLYHLLEATLKHTRTFKIYHQFKMYNDNTLNPELYS